MGWRGACYVPGKSRSLTSGAHKPWDIMGWPIVNAVAWNVFGKGDRLRRQTIDPRVRPEIKTTTFAPSVHMTLKRSLEPSPMFEFEDSGYLGNF